MAPSRTADVCCAHVRAAVARARARGRLALIIGDHLRTPTPAGARLVRQMVAEWQDHLRIIYTPAYDPDANRIEWLWRWSRRAVTHTHHRETFATLVQDIRVHFQALAQQPTLVLRPLGSPFVDQTPEEQPEAWAA